MELFVKRRVRLEGVELQEFQKKEKQDIQKIKKSEYVQQMITYNNLSLFSR